MDHFVNSTILGIVEGITEFLPVSSTGHLLITESILKCHQSDTFNVLIQVGPIIAATLVFWKYIVGLFTGIGTTEKRDELVKLAACFFLTGIGGLIATKLGLKLPETVLPIVAATLIGGIIILLVEQYAKKKSLNEVITWPIVFAVAIGQLLAAVFPGTSRSGAAIMAALLLGVTRPAAVRFAFLVGIPTMFAAGFLEIKKSIDLGQSTALLAPDAIVAFIVATITAWLSVIWLLKFVQTRNFIPFVWYRLAMGVVMIGLLSTNMLR